MDKLAYPNHHSFTDHQRLNAGRGHGLYQEIQKSQQIN